MELNAATARVLELVRENSTGTGIQLLEQQASELNMPRESVIEFGKELFQQFVQLSIISGCRST